MTRTIRLMMRSGRCPDSNRNNREIKTVKAVTAKAARQEALAAGQGGRRRLTRTSKPLSQ
eukprot:710384-Lingulodinium_polyedra.AAC.1